MYVYFFNFHLVKNMHIRSLRTFLLRAYGKQISWVSEIRRNDTILKQNSLSPLEKKNEKKKDKRV